MLKNKFSSKDYTYIQVYPQRNFTIGCYIKSPTEAEVEDFYGYVSAIDLRHESFILIAPIEETIKLIFTCEMEEYVRKYLHIALHYKEERVNEREEKSCYDESFCEGRECGECVFR